MEERQPWGSSRYVLILCMKSIPAVSFIAREMYDPWKPEIFLSFSPQSSNLQAIMEQEQSEQKMDKSWKELGKRYGCVLLNSRKCLRVLETSFSFLVPARLDFLRKNARKCENLQKNYSRFKMIFASLHRRAMRCQHHQSLLILGMRLVVSSCAINLMQMYCLSLLFNLSTVLSLF